MRVGIDVDGTIADLINSVCIIYNRERDSRKYPLLTKDDWVDWDFLFAERYGMSRNQMYRMMDRAWFEADEYMQLTEIDIPVQIQRLHDAYHSVHIVTSRRWVTHVPVVEWLQTQGIEYDGITFIPDGVDKFDMPIDELIDDAPKFVVSAQIAKRKHLYLRDALYNRYIKEENLSHVTRVWSIREAVDLILLRSGTDSSQIGER